MGFDRHLRWSSEGYSWLKPSKKRGNGPYTDRVNTAVLHSALNFPGNGRRLEFVFWNQHGASSECDLWLSVRQNGDELC